MTDGLVVTIPVSPDGPAMRRRRGQLPPPRRPRLSAYRLAKFADRTFNDRSEQEARDLATADWRGFLEQRFSLSDAEQRALRELPPEVVDEIANAVRALTKSGGAIAVALPEGRKGGEITFFGPEASPRRRAAARPSGDSSRYTIPIVKCSFDANCRNWRCRPG